MKPLAPNTLLQNRYLIVQLIGKGGMGEVYLAVDQRLGSAVALKRTFFSDDETLGSAFEREARTLARLRHPVLPKVSDHFTENETQYLVMEHITGDDLSKRLELTDKPFPLNWVLFWADQLLDVLAYLHGHEPPIVHRDIKPQNLKLTDENHIVLLDFGLAKNSIGNTRASNTTGGSVVGYTPHYAPMEQIRGTGTNPRSDIYSFSATFYQLMTNTIPADALTRADSVLNGIADPVDPLNKINADIPKNISDIILKGNGSEYGSALCERPRYAKGSARKLCRDAGRDGGADDGFQFS
ncbi:MAG: serine/threonine protein kinase [Pyrinomonadaceae bacterium]